MTSLGLENRKTPKNIWDLVGFSRVTQEKSMGNPPRFGCFLDPGNPVHFSQDGCSTGLLRDLNAFQEPDADLSKSPQRQNHRGFRLETPNMQLSG